MKVIGIALFIAGAILSVVNTLIIATEIPLLTVLGFFQSLIGSALIVVPNVSKRRPEDFDRKWSKLIAERPHAIRIIDVYLLPRIPSYHPLCFWQITSAYLVFAPLTGFVFGTAMWVLSGFKIEASFALIGLTFGAMMGIAIVIGEMIYRKVYRLPNWNEFCSADVK